VDGLEWAHGIDRSSPLALLHYRANPIHTFTRICISPQQLSTGVDYTPGPKALWQPEYLTPATFSTKTHHPIHGNPVATLASRPDFDHTLSPHFGQVHRPSPTPGPDTQSKIYKSSVSSHQQDVGIGLTQPLPRHQCLPCCTIYFYLRGYDTSPRCTCLDNIVSPDSPREQV
jgi:hypothetical protein